MWHVIYTATVLHGLLHRRPAHPPGPPDSFEFAETMKTWHADGTEWEEKIEPAPVGFCFGVWTHTANGRVTLTPFRCRDGARRDLGGIFYQDELNRVAPYGSRYSGTWDFKLYGPTDVLGTGPVLQEIKGTTAATRMRRFSS